MNESVPADFCERSRGRSFGVIYLAMLLLALHWALVTYANSTFLRQFVDDAAIGIFYTIGSALTVIAFLFISRALGKLGNYKLTGVLIAVEAATLVGLAFADSLRVAIPLFVLHHTLVPLMLFNIDVFTEYFIGTEEASTGSRRGAALTIISLAGAIAPLATGFILGSGEPRFTALYLTSAALLLPLAYLIAQNFRTFTDPPYRAINVLDAIRCFWTTRDLRFVFLAHFLLQLFFAWMVIYVPLYLATVIGFYWSEIGFILFVGLLAYVLLEYPIGQIADRYLGEKEMMAAGFIVLVVSVGALGLLITPLVIPWAITMFMTRVGASLVEATTESYFFKHTTSGEANTISFFRSTRPLAYLAGALLGSLTLLYLPFQGIFFVLAVAMVPGIGFALALKDTK